MEGGEEAKRCVEVCVRRIEVQESVVLGIILALGASKGKYGKNGELFAVAGSRRALEEKLEDPAEVWEL